METLFQKLGGRDAVKAAVEIFYKKIMADSSINGFFNDIDMDAQRRKQILFMTYAFGGPSNYDGKDMREGHKHLVEKGLNEDHFNAVATHLVATLEELNIEQVLIDEVISIVGSTKNEVLNL